MTVSVPDPVSGGHIRIGTSGDGLIFLSMAKLTRYDLGIVSMGLRLSRGLPLTGGTGRLGCGAAGFSLKRLVR